MGFTIELKAPPRDDPERANRVLAAELRRMFSSLTDFPLDHDLIAREYARVPREDVLDHWAQLELHGDETIGSPIITIWLEAVFIELPSTPSESCEARLRRVQPILDVLRAQGFRVPPMATLVAQYQEQRTLVEAVARSIGGRTPSG